MLRVCACVCLCQPLLGFTPPELVGGCSPSSEVVLSGAADCFSLAALTYLLVAGMRSIRGRGVHPTRPQLVMVGLGSRVPDSGGWGRPPRGTCGGRSCTAAFLAVASPGFGSTAVSMHMHVLPPHRESNEGRGVRVRALLHRVVCCQLLFAAVALLVHSMRHTSVLLYVLQARSCYLWAAPQGSTGAGCACCWAHSCRGCPPHCRYRLCAIVSLETCAA